MTEQLDHQEIERLKGLKNKERMQIPRQKMPEQSAQERRRNFNEVPHGLPSMLAVLARVPLYQSFRYFDWPKMLPINRTPSGRSIMASGNGTIEAKGSTP